ncbi:hypothetical protein Hanom_Chr00s000670g01654371 [Helianthus anomalus]
MVEPSNPHSPVGENPDPSSPVAAEEEEGDAPGGGLPVLRWTKTMFDILLRDTQMPPEYGAIYPQEGETGADAPAGYIRNFEYTFRAFGIEPTVGDFRRFYQMTVSLGFFSFRQRDGSAKLMAPPKGLTKWRTQFFFVKVTTIIARLQLRNVTDTIITENISLSRVDMVDWFSDLRIIGWEKLDNTQLWVRRMMLGRMSRKARPVVMLRFRECSAHISRAKLWCCHVKMVRRDSMSPFVIISGCLCRPHLRWRNLGALGDPDGTGVPKQHLEKHGDKKFRRAKKPHEPVVIPPLVPEVVGISRVRLRTYTDYVVVSATLEGLGVPGGGAGAGGSSTGVKPAAERKRKGDAVGAGG